MVSVIGVDLGGTNIVGARVDETGDILSRAHRRTVSGGVASDVVDGVVAVIDELKTPDVIGVAIGSPGVVDPVNGVCKSQAFNLPGWEGLRLADIIRERIDLPTLVDNDANLAALGEYWKGAGRGEKLMLIFTLGTGIGGGIIMDGKIFYGATYRGVEFGLISVDANSDRHLAGCRGAVECYASATAIQRDARHEVKSHPDSLILKLAGGDPESIDARTVCEADKNGDPVATRILDNAMKYLACAIGTAINILNPTAVVLAGGVAKAGEPILSRVQRELHSGRAFKPIMDHCTIALAELGDDAGVLGAATLALDTFHRPNT